jgi:hypothetical protein
MQERLTPEPKPINPEKLDREIKNIRELVEGNRNLVTNEEYLNSLGMLTAFDIAVKNAQEEK